MGNEALAQGALEAGVTVATGYPGTPSSEIIETLAHHTQDNLYVEWSINEKVALEVAAAASLAGLRSVCVMKQNGVNVASDFLLHLAISGTRGGIVLITCDDPGALSSMNEQDSRYFAKLVEIPLLEPATFQHAIDMTKWAFDLSEILQTIVMVRSTTRLSHAMGTVTPGTLPDTPKKARFEHDGALLDYETGPVTCAPVVKKHETLQKKLEKAHALFNSSPFNEYTGPESPDLLIITSGITTLYSKEAVYNLNLQDTVGVLSVGTTYPLPADTILNHVKTTETVLFVEEVAPFIEEGVKALCADVPNAVTFYGKNNIMPTAGELTPDIVTTALSEICDIPVPKKNFSKIAPQRKLTFCAGCPHRASLWSIHKILKKNGQYGFVCGDIGCYTMDIFSEYRTIKTIHSMGSGIGLASGFGKLDQFGLDQPVLAVCGDSTFFHAAIPALINAVHNSSNLILVVLDNKGTAMTGFQPHPGLPVDTLGNKAPSVDIATVCTSIGAHVTVVDPFDLEKTEKTLLNLLKKSGVRVLILRQVCALSSKQEKKYMVYVDEDMCKGKYGCSKPCTQVFCCPGLVWDKEKEVTKIDEVICVECGVCTDICPVGAIKKEEIT